MPFISRDNIDPAIRAKHEKEYKAKLRSALTNPALTKEERAHIQEQLNNVGKPKVYRNDSPPKPGALTLS